VLSRGPLLSTATTVISQRLNHTWRLYQGQEVCVGDEIDAAVCVFYFVFISFPFGDMLLTFQFAEITYRIDSLEIVSAPKNERETKSHSQDNFEQPQRRRGSKNNLRKANELKMQKMRNSKNVGENDSNNNLMTRFATHVQNGNVFYTDDSGWLLRRREMKNPILLEASTYPSIEYAFINDSVSQVCFQSFFFFFFRRPTHT
jgi:hypothetical protein